MTVGTLSYIDAIERWAGCHPLEQCRVVGRQRFKGKSDFVKAPLTSAGIQTLLAGLEATQASTSHGGAALICDAYGGAINRVPNRPRRPSSTATRCSRSSTSRAGWATAQAISAGSGSCMQQCDRMSRDSRIRTTSIPISGPWEHAYYGSNLTPPRRGEAEARPGQFLPLPAEHPQTRLAAGGGDDLLQRGHMGGEPLPAQRREARTRTRRRRSLTGLSIAT